MDINYKDLLNKSTEEVITILNELKVIYRIVRQDDLNFAITQDLVPDRLNLHIDNDIVTEIKQF